VTVRRDYEVADVWLELESMLAARGWTISPKARKLPLMKR